MPTTVSRKQSTRQLTKAMRRPARSPNAAESSSVSRKAERRRRGGTRAMARKGTLKWTSRRRNRIVASILPGSGQASGPRTAAMTSRGAGSCAGRAGWARSGCAPPLSKEGALATRTTKFSPVGTERCPLAPSGGGQSAAAGTAAAGASCGAPDSAASEHTVGIKVSSRGTWREVATRASATRAASSGMNGGGASPASRLGGGVVAARAGECVRGFAVDGRTAGSPIPKGWRRWCCNGASSGRRRRRGEVPGASWSWDGAVRGRSRLAYEAAAAAAAVTWVAESSVVRESS
jgi:hypothetical protein